MSDGGVGWMMFFAVDFMVVNFANRAVWRHPIPGQSIPSLRANGSAPTGRANARPMTGSAPPDDRLREAIHGCNPESWIASSLALLAMTRNNAQDDGTSPAPATRSHHRRVECCA